PVDLARGHDVVVDRAHLGARLRILDHLHGRHDASCSVHGTTRGSCRGSGIYRESPHDDPGDSPIAHAQPFGELRGSHTPAGSTERTIMRALTIATILLLSATGSTPALAQTAAWISHGPEGGSIPAIAVDARSPSRVYAGSLGDGVFLSTERGEIWNGTGPANAQVVTLAIDTLNPLGGREQPGETD